MELNIYIFFSDNIIFSEDDDINKFIPSTNIKIFLFLSEKDRLKSCFDDVKQFNKITKNINLILNNKLFYKDLVFLNYFCKFENVLENNFNNIIIIICLLLMVIKMNLKIL